MNKSSNILHEIIKDSFGNSIVIFNTFSLRARLGDYQSLDVPVLLSRVDEVINEAISLGKLDLITNCCVPISINAGSTDHDIKRVSVYSSKGVKTGDVALTEHSLMEGVVYVSALLDEYFFVRCQYLKTKKPSNMLKSQVAKLREQLSDEKYDLRDYCTRVLYVQNSMLHVSCERNDAVIGKLTPPDLASEMVKLTFESVLRKLPASSISASARASSVSWLESKEFVTPGTVYENVTLIPKLESIFSLSLLMFFFRGSVVGSEETNADSIESVGVTCLRLLDQLTSMREWSGELNEGSRGHLLFVADIVSVLKSAGAASYVNKLSPNQKLSFNNIAPLLFSKLSDICSSVDVDISQMLLCDTESISVIGQGDLNVRARGKSFSAKLSKDFDKFGSDISVYAGISRDTRIKLSQYCYALVLYGYRLVSNLKKDNSNTVNELPDNLKQLLSLPYFTRVPTLVV